MKTFWSVGEHCICCAKEAKARGLSDRMVLACLLHDVLEHGINDRKDDDVKKMLTFANAAASLITTRKGALRVMPEKGEVEAVIK